MMGDNGWHIHLELMRKEGPRSSLLLAPSLRTHSHLKAVAVDDPAAAGRRNSFRGHNCSVASVVDDVAGKKKRWMCDGGGRGTRRKERDIAT